MPNSIVDVKDSLIEDGRLFNVDGNISNSIPCDHFYVFVIFTGKSKLHRRTLLERSFLRAALEISLLSC